PEPRPSPRRLPDRAVNEKSRGGAECAASDCLVSGHRFILRTTKVVSGNSFSGTAPNRRSDEPLRRRATPLGDLGLGTLVTEDCGQCHGIVFRCCDTLTPCLKFVASVYALGEATLLA